MSTQFEPDALVWISSNRHVWQPGRVLSASAGDVKVELVGACDAGGGWDNEEGGIVTIPCDGSGSLKLLRRDPVLSGAGALKFDDLTEVPELHEAELLHALEVRFAQGAIYTLTGPVLLAVNPFRTLPGLYGSEVLRTFLSGSAAAPQAARPHVYCIAARALRGIQEQRLSQTVLISGESGAGKTETTKFVMQFLALAGTEAGHVAAHATAAHAAAADAVAVAGGGGGGGGGGGVGRPRPRGDSASGGAGMTPRLRRSDSLRSSGSGGSPMSASGGGGGGGGMSRIDRQVLSSNPLLEAFGNAKTLRNDNSSRFGKYIELQFGTENFDSLAPPRIVGGRIRTYLLEKVRIVSQHEGERNFHIFYQALAAAQASSQSSGRGGLGGPSFCPGGAPGGVGVGGGGEIDLQAFAGLAAEDFAYLAATATSSAAVGGAGGDGLFSGCGGGGGGRGPGLPLAAQCSEVEGFEATVAAMRAVGFGAADMSEVFRALGAVLHLGNLKFSAVTSESSQVSDDRQSSLPASATTGGLRPTAAPQRPPLDVVCDLLGVAEDALTLALCSRTMQTPGEGVIRMNNSASKAADFRDGLARHLYLTIFGYVVHRTNQSIGFQEDAVFCGVLDIFGFEFFETNSFEQLCINFTNELLQQYFNTFIFENEASLYQQEGISWEPQDFPDNGRIVALLQDRLTGVLPMLEEECFQVGGSSGSWHSKIAKKHADHPNFGVVLLQKGVFIIHHFAGPVNYTAEGFMEKNKDQLSSDLLSCLKGSGRSFVRDRFLEHDRVFGAGGGSAAASSLAPGSPQKVSAPGSPKKVTKALRYSVSSQFRQQLQDLLAQIRTTQPHFVRCIKPNPQNRPFADATSLRPKPLFDRPSVAQQLSYQGVLEAIRVARAGFPVRLKHRAFFAEFRCLGPRGLRSPEDAGCRPASIIRQLVEHPRVHALLAGEGPIATATGGAAASTRWAIGLTRVFLKQEPYIALRAARLQARHAAATRLQAAHRGRTAARAFLRFRRAIRLLQGLARARAARKELLRLRRIRAATAVEAGLRTLLKRSCFARGRRAVLAAQSWKRSRRVRADFLMRRWEAVRLQRWWRSLQRRRRLRRLRRNVLRVQAVYRGLLGRRAALAVKADRFRLVLAVRRLVRIRRRSAARRTWREEVMAKYRCASVQPAPPREALVRELGALVAEYERKQAEVERLRAETEQWQHGLAMLRTRAFFRVRRLIRPTAAAAAAAESPG